MYFVSKYILMYFCPSLAVDEDRIGPDDAVLRPRLKNSETLGNLDSLLNHLPSEGKAELKEMILSYDVLFSDSFFRLGMPVIFNNFTTQFL